MSGFVFLIGQGATKTKTVGKIPIEQMTIVNSDKWILSRISPKCENCSSNKYYGVICDSKPYIFVFPIFDKTYKIVCPECGETIELDYEEYLVLEPFLKINKKYEKEKISKKEYKYRIAEISDKYERKYNRD